MYGLTNYQYAESPWICGLVSYKEDELDRVQSLSKQQLSGGKIHQIILTSTPASLY